MAWLRVDDKFARHPKILALSRDDRWTWLEVLCYCAEYKTDGKLPQNIAETVPKAGLRFCNEALQIGLLDKAEDGSLVVHDWPVYNPKDPLKQARQARWRDGKKDACVDASVDDGVDGPVDGPHGRGRAGAFPSPTPTPVGPDQKVRDNSTAAGTTADEPAAELEQKLKTLGWWPGQIEAAHQKPELAWAWIHYAERNADTNPGALSREGFESGQPPSAGNNGTRPADVYTACLNYLSSPEAQDELSTRNVILEEFTIRERKIGKTLTPEQRGELLAIWEAK